MSEVHYLKKASKVNTITLVSDDGRSALLDFGGERVTFSGDLPVDDAARIFFEAVSTYTSKPR